jgi:hypothetical protein
MINLTQKEEAHKKIERQNKIENSADDTSLCTGR